MNGTIASVEKHGRECPIDQVDIGKLMVHGGGERFEVKGDAEAWRNAGDGRQGAERNLKLMGWSRACRYIFLRRASRYTCVCASAANPPTAQDRRRLLQTEFDHASRP